MPTGQIPVLQMEKACRAWGFTEVRNTGDHRIMKGPNGAQISIRRGSNKVNAHTVSLAADACGVSYTDFLKGPVKEKKKRGVLNTAPRRQVIEFLHANGGEVRDENGYLTAWMMHKMGIEKQGKGHTAAFSTLLKSMETDGQIIRDCHVPKKTFAVALNYDGPHVKSITGGPAPAAVPAPEPVVPDSTPQPEVDLSPAPEIPEELGGYGAIREDQVPFTREELADALLDRVEAIISQGGLDEHKERWDKQRTELQEKLNNEIDYVSGLRRKVAKLEQETLEQKRTIERLSREKLIADDALKQVNRNGTRPVSPDLVAAGRRGKKGRR